MESSLEMYSFHNFKIHQFVKIVSNLGLQYQYPLSYFEAKLPLVMHFYLTKWVQFYGIAH